MDDPPAPTGRKSGLPADLRPVCNAFAIAAAGVALFHAGGLPLPWLLGPIAACLAAALAGVRLGGIAPLNTAMRTILGVAVGASLTASAVAGMAAYWPTLVLMPLMVVVIGLIGIPYFTRICRYDLTTAYFGAMPGGFSDMLAFGAEAGGNLRALSLIHATRLLVIVVALPFLLRGIWHADLSNAPGAPAADLPVSQLLLMAGCAIAGWWAAARVGLFGAAILGPLILTGALTIAGVIAQRPPAEAVWAAQFFIGMSVGGHYSGITLREMRRDIVAGLGFCGILIVLTILFVEAIYAAGLAPGQEALLAFAPGGQAELTVLALVVGADMAFVVAHHVVRMLVVILGAPLAHRLFHRG